MIEFHDVRKRFARGPEALRGVTLSVPAGETLAVIGPNGAGKSTLLALALGFLRPTGGAVLIEGLDPRGFVRRRGAGWVPERFQLPAAWRVGATLDYFARLDGGGPGAAREALEHFGLQPHSGKRAGELSHGLSRRLALAIAMLGARPLVILDEPTTGLDVQGRERFRERLERLRGNGTTILLASQDLAEAERIADRAVVLEKGVARAIVPLRAGTAQRAWHLELDGPFDRMAEYFPDARVTGTKTFRVEAADASELSSRLRALLDAGAVISAVRPAGLLGGPAGSPLGEPAP